jgi:hypothetical protein
MSKHSLKKREYPLNVLTGGLVYSNKHPPGCPGKDVSSKNRKCLSSEGEFTVE